MTFQPGNKLSKGRPRGSLNKRSLDFAATLEKNNFDPVQALIDCYRDARTVYDGYATIYAAIQEAKSEQAGYDVPLEDKSHLYLKIALDAAKEIASYTFPKLKSIERAPNSPLDGMTTAEKLEAMKQAVKALELQQAKEKVDGPEPTPSPGS